MRNTGGCALIAGSGVLLIGAIAINSTALFLMATALGVMILTCRLQAWLSVRGLRLERECPSCVNVGDTVTIKIGVGSDYAFKRPLVTVTDILPEEMDASNQSPSLPVAPSHDAPVYTQYQFEAKRRGKFVLRSLLVEGSDALGLVRMRRKYSAEATELLVLPVPIPFEVRLPYAAGWGFSESDYGRSRGQGIEPRGIREYSDGDSQRYIHWRSSAKTSQLMVKEFETGALSKAYVFIQAPKGSAYWKSQAKILDTMCGNAAYLCDSLLSNSAEVFLPALFGDIGHHGASQRYSLLKALAEISVGGTDSVSADIQEANSCIAQGSTVYLLLSQEETELDHAISRLGNSGVKTIAILYRRLDESFVSKLQAAGATIQFEVRV